MRFLLLLCFIYSALSETWFIHYYDNAAKSWSEYGGKRIANEARRYFDHVITYRKTDLGEDFIRENAAHFQHKRGAGYWMWKPRVAQITLALMKEGDDLMYADTGCEIRSSPAPLFALLNEQDIACFHLQDFHPDKRWTKRDLSVALNMTSRDVLDSSQRLATFFLLRKNNQTVAFVDEWLMYNKQLHLIDDTPSVEPNDPIFVEHRHDQSIWSLLTKKYGYRARPDISWPPETATIIATSRRGG